MRKFFCTIVVVLSSVLLLTACGQNRGNVEVAPSLSVDSVGVMHRDSVGEFKLSADFAHGTDGVLVNAINEYIMEMFDGKYEGDYLDRKALLDFCLAKEVKDYHDMWNEMAEVSREDMHLLHDANIKLTYEAPKFATFTYTCESYMGGAHGSFVCLGQTFRKIDGRRFDWSLVDNYASEEFQNLIKDGLKEYFNVKTDEQLKENLMLENEYVIPLPQCPPLFEEKGITFVYQQYEIACYAAGLPTFTVPYEKILPLMSVTAKKLVN